VTQPRWDELTEEDVDRLTVRVMRRAWRARPEVRKIRLGGRDAVVKDYGRRGNLFKRLLGTFLARREVAALRRVEGIPNVPRVLASPQPWMLVIEHVNAKSVTALDAPRLDREFFDRLTSLVDELHGRGLAHGDLEKLDNILVTPAMQPAVVDFAASVMSGANPLAALALGHMQDNDRRAICKLKSLFAPELLTDDEQRRLAHRGAAELWFRRLRKYVRRPVKSLATGNDERARG